MKSSRIRSIVVFAVLAIALAVSGCAKKAVEQPPTSANTPPVPGGPAPTSTPSAPAPTTPAPTTNPSSSLDLQPAFFDLDSDALREDARAALDKDARALRENATVSVTIEGHCDERGTAEYNQALGERRAQAAKDYLVAAGIAESRLKVVSYGKERPFSEGHDESSWQQNRRAHLTSQ
jgi:peptidoglycan-associated lipoprotein